jgi:hypothetical protein
MRKERPAFALGRRLQMSNQVSISEKNANSVKTDVRIDLDEVVRSLEEAAKEIEKVDWEHGGIESNDR